MYSTSTFRGKKCFSLKFLLNFVAIFSKHIFNCLTKYSYQKINFDEQLQADFAILNSHATLMLTICHIQTALWLSLAVIFKFLYVQNELEFYKKSLNAEHSCHDQIQLNCAGSRQLADQYKIHKTITACIIVGFNILLEYIKRLRPFHLVLIRVKSEQKNYILTSNNILKMIIKLRKRKNCSNITIKNISDL